MRKARTTRDQSWAGRRAPFKIGREGALLERWRAQIDNEIEYTPFPASLLSPLGTHHGGVRRPCLTASAFKRRHGSSEAEAAILKPAL